MTMDVQFINAGSAFAQEVFKTVRPSIPRERWPVEPIRVTFTPLIDGLGLVGNFDDVFPPRFAALATRLVVDAGVDLVVLSPAAHACAAMVRAKRWRDAFLYAFLPLLFAVPLMGALADKAMMAAAALFVADLILLILAQARMSRRRVELAAARFVAEIPVPGMKLHVAAKT